MVFAWPWKVASSAGRYRYLMTIFDPFCFFMMMMMMMMMIMIMIIIISSSPSPVDGPALVFDDISLSVKGGLFRRPLSHKRAHPLRLALPHALQNTKGRRRERSSCDDDCARCYDDDDDDDDDDCSSPP
jgi:hypothetical protein